jgi:hypothetical protein
MSTIVEIITCLAIGMGVVAFVRCFGLYKTYSGLQDQLTDLNDRIDDNDKLWNETTKIYDKAIQATCPHDDWEYIEEVHGYTTGLGFKHEYYKTCIVCSKKIEIDKAEYDAGLKAKELKEIEEARKELEARQSKVMSSGTVRTDAGSSMHDTLNGMLCVDK